MKFLAFRSVVGIRAGKRALMVVSPSGKIRQHNNYEYIRTNMIPPPQWFNKLFK